MKSRKGDLSIWRIRRGRRKSRSCGKIVGGISVVAWCRWSSGKGRRRSRGEGLRGYLAKAFLTKFVLIMSRFLHSVQSVVVSCCSGNLSLYESNVRKLRVIDSAKSLSDLYSTRSLILGTQRSQRQSKSAARISPPRNSRNSRHLFSSHNSTY